MSVKATMTPQNNAAPPTKKTLLDWIEWAGNKLPEPALLFALLAAIAIVLSAWGAAAGWSVQPVAPVLLTEAITQADGSVLQQAVLDEHGRPKIKLEASGAPLTPRSLLSADGIYWMFSSMLRNFAQMPALPLIFVAMLGIGVAEKFGFFSALMRWLALRTPARWLTPVVVFLGANASVASDAGYIILPPLAAALYLAVGRHPIAGLAAAFVGVAGGFGGGFFPTGSDGVLTGFAQDAARVIDPNYSVSILHNYYFKIASALVVTLAGWLVTDFIVEPRLRRQQPQALSSNETSAVHTMALTGQESRALFGALGVMAAVLALLLALVLIPGMPLHGDGKPTLPNGRVLTTQAVQILPADAVLEEGAEVLARSPLTVLAQGPARLSESPGPRWSQVIVPMILLVFLLPGMLYGRMTGQLRSQLDLVDAFASGIRSIVPVLVILFFLAQFVGVLGYSGLDRMLAYAGGSVLFEAALPIPILLVLFVAVVIFGDFAMSGMLSKFGVLAPIFIPMFMIVGMSPELTTAAYRIGDSVVNIVTPLNSYMLIVLAVLQKYRTDAGLGSLIALMVPYSVVLGLLWTGLLVLWYVFGLPLGPNAPLMYLPG
jgi:aminobenzoyl-glutamate transport protein